MILALRAGLQKRSCYYANTSTDYPRLPRSSSLKNLPTPTLSCNYPRLPRSSCQKPTTFYHDARTTALHENMRNMVGWWHWWLIDWSILRLAATSPLKAASWQRPTFFYSVLWSRDHHNEHNLCQCFPFDSVASFKDSYRLP